jgi:hypothetical protein
VLVYWVDLNPQKGMECGTATPALRDPSVFRRICNNNISAPPRPDARQQKIAKKGAFSMREFAHNWKL